MSNTNASTKTNTKVNNNLKVGTKISMMVYGCNYEDIRGCIKSAKGNHTEVWKKMSQDILRFQDLTKIPKITNRSIRDDIAVETGSDASWYRKPNGNEEMNIGYITVYDNKTLGMIMAVDEREQKNGTPLVDRSFHLTAVHTMIDCGKVYKNSIDQLAAKARNTKKVIVQGYEFFVKSPNVFKVKRSTQTEKFNRDVILKKLENKKDLSLEYDLKDLSIANPDEWNKTLRAITPNINDGGAWLSKLKPSEQDTLISYNETNGYTLIETSDASVLATLKRMCTNLPNTYVLADFEVASFFPDKEGYGPAKDRSDMYLTSAKVIYLDGCALRFAIPSLNNNSSDVDDEDEGEK